MAPLPAPAPAGRERSADCLLGNVNAEMWGELGVKDCGPMAAALRKPPSEPAGCLRPRRAASGRRALSKRPVGVIPCPTTGKESIPAARIAHHQRPLWPTSVSSPFGRYRSSAAIPLAAHRKRPISAPGRGLPFWVGVGKRTVADPRFPKGCFRRASRTAAAGQQLVLPPVGCGCVCPRTVGCARSLAVWSRISPSGARRPSLCLQRWAVIFWSA